MGGGPKDDRGGGGWGGTGYGSLAADRGLGPGGLLFRRIPGTMNDAIRALGPGLLLGALLLSGCSQDGSSGSFQKPRETPGSTQLGGAPPDHSSMPSGAGQSGAIISGAP